MNVKRAIFNVQLSRVGERIQAGRLFNSKAGDPIIMGCWKWRVTPVLLNMRHLGCAVGKNSAHLEQLTTLPGAWFLGYKAGE
jgi:hypothetical protein